MSELPPATPGDFLAQIARDVKGVRADYVDQLVSMATTRFDDDGPKDDALRGKYMREFMRYAAGDFEVALFQKMARGPSNEDRINAARFYLYGVSEKFWTPQAETLNLARNLCATAASAPANFDFQSALQAIARPAMPSVRDAFMHTVHDPKTEYRDRLLAIEKVLQGVVAGLWPIPAEWEGATNG
jgi:hypothetical protein